MANIRKNRVGEIGYNNFGSKMEIIRYNRNDDIDVYFEEYDWACYNTQYDKFKKGSIKCPYEKSVYNIGYYGEGNYKCRENNKDTKCYKTWHDMLERCYSEDYQNKKPTYIGCEVCEEWHNFQNFAKWYEDNYYECNEEKMHLDKDILYKGNKIYSPQTCVFVPERINTLFVKNNASRGEYPIGISYNKNGNNLRVRCNDENNKVQYLGSFKLNQELEAFQCYKKYKENIIKQIANKYKVYIPNILYNAMYNYRIEIDD